MMMKLTFALTAASLALFAAAPTAQAWGICGRGAFQSMTEISSGFGEPSVCSCSDGTEGSAQTLGEEGAIVAALYMSPNVPSDTGVGLEMEAFDAEWNRYVVPMLVDSDVVANAQPGETFFNRVFAGWWTNGFHFSGRYRSVCIANMSHFLYTHRSMTVVSRSQWFY
jgi:hypothetical protein